MKKLDSGLRVRLWKIKDAGGYEVYLISSFSKKVSIELSGGQPFESVYRESELLATMIDAEFVFSEGMEDKIIRYSLKGKYFEEQEAK